MPTEVSRHTYAKFKYRIIKMRYFLLIKCVQNNFWRRFIMEKTNSRKSFTVRLVVSAVLIALATVLSNLKIYKMPLGGSVTLMSMVPIVLIAVMYGTKWGIGSSFVYSILQFMLGAIVDGLFGWGLNAPSLIGTILLDYIVAFTVIGIAGIFRKKGLGGIVLGSALALLGRFVSHLLSGVIIFANYEQFELFGSTFVGKPWLYSICYNGLYMLPEIIITCVAVGVLFNLPQIKKLVKEA